MQITLVQAEIEEAIRAYVNTQLTIREGMQIDIDLAATRGPTGFTASIHIHPAKEQATAALVAAPAPVAPAPAPAPVMQRPVVVPMAQPETKADTFQEDPPVSERIRPVEVAPVAEPETEEAKQEEQPTMAISTESPPEEGTARRSLFKNLRKPVNS